jgi:hypothetical protein
MSTIAASPPFQFLSRPQATTTHGAPDRRLFPAARHAIAWTWNTKIISNAAFRFSVFSRSGACTTKNGLDQAQRRAMHYAARGANLAREHQLACGQQ